jgi:DNA polymerase bacteriophage-type
MGNPAADAWIAENGEKCPFYKAVRSHRRLNSMRSKLGALQLGTIDGRYYGGMLYCGAHTRRWSGGGGNFNLQNIPRGDAESGEMFGVNFRAMFCAKPGYKLVVADLAQIEIRTLMWFARDFEMLERIANTDDIYHPMGVQFNMWDDSRGPLRGDPATRHKVKAMVLGAQFGGSSRAYMSMNGGTEEAAKGAVALYRHRMRSVVQLWERLERGLNTSVRDGSFEISLPSGNSLHYQSLRRTGDGLLCTMIRNGRPLHCRPWYGMLAENCAQALARDVFADRLLELERVEFPWNILFTVHDEVVIECREEAANDCISHVKKVFSTPPDWIPDIPLQAEVKVMDFYNK